MQSKFISFILNRTTVQACSSRTAIAKTSTFVQATLELPEVVAVVDSEEEEADDSGAADEALPLDEPESSTLFDELSPPGEPESA